MLNHPASQILSNGGNGTVFILTHFRTKHYLRVSPEQEHISLSLAQVVKRSLGVFFLAEGPPSKNTFGRVICKQTQHEGVSWSYNPGSFGMTVRLETNPSKNTFSRVICKQTQHKGVSRSYNLGSFGMTARLETKGSTDLKSKRPFSPW
jgi:hypothetical protein